MSPPVTPDGRYIVVRGRLWRAANPHLTSKRREQLVKTLMSARRDVAAAKRAGDRESEHTAHERVDRAKQELGERGPIWWTDGAPDYNRHLVKNTPYNTWWGETRQRDDARGRGECD